jgi:TPP-dependent trihydroxycyclohexane-1,2-dione (THcHDO) dehydratase
LLQQVDGSPTWQFQQGMVSPALLQVRLTDHLPNPHSQGLGVFPTDDEQSLNMLGMHGTVYANYAIDQADLLIALGVR